MLKNDACKSDEKLFRLTTLECKHRDNCADVKMSKTKILCDSFSFSSASSLSSSSYTSSSPPPAFSRLVRVIADECRGRYYSRLSTIIDYNL
jgi:hypothetical protein